MKHFCHEASHLLSDRYERELTLTERLHLRIHLWMCGKCSNYGANLQLLDRLCAELRRTADTHAPCLSEKDKQRILASVREAGAEQPPVRISRPA